VVVLTYPRFMKWFYTTTNPHFRRIGTEQVKTQQHDYNIIRAQMGLTTGTQRRPDGTVVDNSVEGTAFKTTGPLPEELKLTSILQATY
jgi:hypothetical protein